MKKSIQVSAVLPTVMAALVVVAGCATQPAPADAGNGITEVKLEAPTAPPSVSPVAAASRDAELAELRHTNEALSSEIERLQSKNREYAMQNARLREGVVSRPLPSAAVSGESAIDSPPPVATVAETTPNAAGGTYSVQTASYSNSDKGRKSAEKLCDFFRRQGFEPATYRESGKYLIVLVGAFGDRESARETRDRIAGLDYHGRSGDFASATIRRN